MKFKFNIYLIIAVAIIGAITGSLAMSLGEIEPAASAAIILVSVLVLGWGAGSVSSQAEIDRLTSIETGRRIQANCLITARNRLERDLDQLLDAKGGVL
jgi:sulfite exporter TauE/SafE